MGYNIEDYRMLYPDVPSEPPVIAVPETGGCRSVLSLFSGCGGMDIGFEGGFACHANSVGKPDWVECCVNDKWALLKRNGFKTVFADDIMPEARTVWGDYMYRRGSSCACSAESVVNLVKAHMFGSVVFPKGVDVVTGGFPCQDFSIAGKRMGFDSHRSHDGGKGDAVSGETRGNLYHWMKMVVEIVRPKVFVAENVKGLVSLGDVKDVIRGDFASSGYYVPEPRLLRAWEYGVPEARERVFFIGICKDALLPGVLPVLESGKPGGEYDPYPSPTHGEGLLPFVTCGDIFDGLMEPCDTSDVSQASLSKCKYMGKHCQGQEEIKLSGIGYTIRSEHHGNIQFRRLSAEHGGTIADEISEGLGERRLTVREAALIQTFPPDMRFVIPVSAGRKGVSPSSAYRVIGNAVPPVLAYAIAKRLGEVWPLYFGN